MSTINYLASWCLGTRLNWVSMRNFGCSVFDLNDYHWYPIGSCCNRLWNILTVSNLPACRNLWIDCDSFISLTGKWRWVNLLTVSILVGNLTSLVVGSVGNVDGWVIRLISYRFRWNISFTGGVTSCALSGVIWQFCRRPVTKVTQLASYFIISGTPRNRSGLLSDERFLTRNVIRDRPRYRVNQLLLINVTQNRVRLIAIDSLRRVDEVNRNCLILVRRECVAGWQCLALR